MCLWKDKSFIGRYLPNVYKSFKQYSLLWLFEMKSLLSNCRFKNIEWLFSPVYHKIIGKMLQYGTYYKTQQTLWQMVENYPHNSSLSMLLLHYFGFDTKSRFDQVKNKLTLRQFYSKSTLWDKIV